MKEQNSSLKQNYRPKEAAIYLGVGLTFVWELAKKGKLTPIKLSPRITVFKRSELDSLTAIAQ